jgi:hypothetical protein
MVKARQASRLCTECGSELIKLDWNTACYLFICNNLGCKRYRQPQGTEKKAKASMRR